jgi:hypothetical protein
VAGRAVAADGRGLRAIVTLQPYAPQTSASAKSLAAQSIATEADGSFRFPGLPAGAYSLCALPAAGQGKNANEVFANSCEWRLLQGPYRVAAGQALTVPQGALLRVRVADPLGALTAAASPGEPPGLDPAFQVLLKSADSFVHPLRITSSSQFGREHDVVIPLGVALSLSVKSAQFSVSDSTGRPVAASVPVQAVAGSTLVPIDLTVNGRRP